MYASKPLIYHLLFWVNSLLKYEETIAFDVIGYDVLGYIVFMNYQFFYFNDIFSIEIKVSNLSIVLL